jgi:predicted aspartyl protease
MSVRFNATERFVLVGARIWGPGGMAELRLAIDTGATTTTISTEHLQSVGYDPDSAIDHARIVTASGIESVARIEVAEIAALEQSRRRFQVHAHTLPAATAIDGVLGLDFLRNRRLVLDFRKGRISLT